MAFKKVVDLNADVTITLGGVNNKTGKPNPKMIEGYYLGNRKVPDPKKKSGFSFIYVFKTHKGNVGVWGRTDLEKKMLDATRGVMTRVTQIGMRKTAHNDMYVYEIEVDSENVLDIQSLPSAATTTTTQADSEDAYSSTADDLDYALAEDELSLDEVEDTIPARATPPRVAAKTPGAEQQAAVKALLNSARRQ